MLSTAGCATQDQLRESEAQHGHAVEALRADAGRSESGLAEMRAELRRTQDVVHTLEVALAETRARADAARVQADSALATSREFLSNLVAVREEQRRQLDEGGAAFAELRRKAADLDLKLQAQQRAIDQSSGAFTEASRRLAVVEAGLQEMGRRSGVLEARAKAGQEADEATSRQLVGLRKQVEDTRSVMSSEGLLQLMRGVEDLRRSSASLRGSIDELQKAQNDAAAQTKNFYIDLDTRIRLLKQASLAAPGAEVEQERAEPPHAPEQGGEASPPPRAQPVRR
jgi:chromosome segregation ATPase